MNLTKYKTSVEHLNIEGISVDLLRINNLDDLYNELLAKGDENEEVKDERIPYWADLWHSAIALSQYLIKSNLINKKTSVLEIGCGLGLPGVVAGKLGASVTFTDYVPEALEFARHNWQINNNGNAAFELLDWRKPKSDLAADVVLASDVAYEKRMFQPLVIALKKLIKPGGCAIVSEPNRKLTAPFFKLLDESKFRFKEQIFEIMLNDISVLVNVYCIKKE